MHFRASLLLAAALAAGCSRSGSGPTPDSPAATVGHTFGDPARNHATPSLASRGNRVVLAWSTSATNMATEILVAVSDDAGRTFGAPVRVNDAAAEARVSGEQAPRVVITAREIAVLWSARREMQSQVRLSRSTDGGRTFGASSPVHANGLTGARGWASLAADDAGRLHALWLDGRNAEVSATPAQKHVHGTAAAGAASAAPRSAPRQDLYRAIIEPDGRITELQVATAVCFCCKTAIMTRGDRALTAWRHIYPGSLRDMAFADLGATAPPAHDIVRVSEDGWKIDGCPDDGPAMALSADGRVHLVWPSVVAEPAPSKGIFYASSADARAFAPRDRLDTGPSSAHPQIVSADAHGIIAAWDESANGSRRVVIRRRGTDRDAAWAPAEDVTNGAAGIYPALAIAGDAVLVAWTSQTEPNTTIVVRRLPWP